MDPMQWTGWSIITNDSYFGKKQQFKVKMPYECIYFLWTLIFLVHNMLIGGLELCGLLVI